jgi:hypothetical protein
MLSLEYLQKLKKDERLQAVEWHTCRDDPYYFLINWAKTLDVHDDLSPIKPFPDKEYLRILVDTWLNTQLLLIPKSRQMMMSWLFTTLYLWDTIFHEARMTFFQSKKSEDADDILKRSKFVWDNLPRFLKRFYRNGRGFDLQCNPQHKGQHVTGKMVFPQINSEIRAIPEGGDVIRMHVASGILSDEMAFQPEARAAWTAARPTISSKGRFTGVSTAEHGSFFEELVFDEIETV